jgi:hypothetical protein
LVYAAADRLLNIGNRQDVYCVVPNIDHQPAQRMSLVAK